MFGNCNFNALKLKLLEKNVNWGPLCLEREIKCELGNGTLLIKKKIGQLIKNLLIDISWTLDQKSTYC